MKNTRLVLAIFALFQSTVCSAGKPLPATCTITDGKQECHQGAKAKSALTSYQEEWKATEAAEKARIAEIAKEEALKKERVAAQKLADDLAAKKRADEPAANPVEKGNSKTRTALCAATYSKDLRTLYTSAAGGVDNLPCCPSIPGIDPVRDLTQAIKDDPGLCQPAKLALKEIEPYLERHFEHRRCKRNDPTQTDFEAKWIIQLARLPDSNPLKAIATGKIAPDGISTNDPTLAPPVVGKVGAPVVDPAAENQVHLNPSQTDDTIPTPAPPGGRAPASVLPASVRAESCGRDEINGRLDHSELSNNRYYQVWVKPSGAEWALARKGEAGAECRGAILKIKDSKVSVRGTVVPSFVDKQGKEHFSEMLGYQAMNGDDETIDARYFMQAHIAYTMYEGAGGENLFVKINCSRQGLRPRRVFLQAGPDAPSLEKVEYRLNRDEGGDFSESPTADMIARSDISGPAQYPAAPPADARAR